MREKVEVLEHHPDFLADFIDVDFRIGYVISIHDDMATRNFLKFIQASQKGTLSRAGRADNTDHFLLFYLCTDIFQYFEFAE
ncbi:Uncharacterised protein [Mycobacteroides abscessus subsp. abscessus]|nr:Uncharacterised protein [Mycobacteroides abscessus subsp. abscessus]